MPTPASAIPSGISFQAALADSSDRLNAGNRTTSTESKTRSATSTASRSETKPLAQPLPNESAAPTIPVPPPADQAATQTKVSSGGQDDTRASDGSAKTAAEAPDFSIPGNSPAPSPQLITAQPKADASDQAIIELPQPSVPTPQNKAADAAVPADVSAIPVASGVADSSSVAVPAGPGVAAQPAAETFELQMAPSTAAMLPNKADSIQSAGKAPQKNTADAIRPRNADAPNATDTTNAKPAGTASGGSSHSVQSNSQNNAQSNNQPAQHSQADASQSVAAMPKIADSSAAQAQPIPTPALTHDAPTATATAGSLPEASRPDRSDATPSSLDGDEITAATGINASRIVQSMSETEMRVGLHSSEFGSISIRTSVSPQQMLAQISLDHSGLSQAISAHVASVQTKLGNDSGLNTLIQVNHQAASTTGQGSSQQREPRSSALSVPVAGAAAAPDPDVGINPSVLTGASTGYRLDIRA